MARKCARTFSIVVEKGKKSILDVTHLLPDALPRSVCKKVRIAGAVLHFCSRFLRRVRDEQHGGPAPPTTARTRRRAGQRSVQ